MSAAREQFPWRRLMDWGLRRLALPPEQFWRSTLRELVPVASSPPGAVLRQSLDAMMKQWPDQTTAGNEP